MRSLVHFLRCVGRAAIKNCGRAFANLFPFGDVAFEVARDAFEEYRRDRSEADLWARLDAVTHAPPATVPSPKRTYTLLRMLATGDAADVHLAQAPGATTYVLKTSRGPEGTAMLDTEQRTVARLLTRADGTTYRKYLPTLAESFTAAGQRVTAFVHEDGLYTLEQVHARHPALDGRHLAWIFKRLLTVLGFVHRAGIVHGAVLPGHVLVCPANHGLRLVGWGQSVATGRPIEALATAYRDWYPPEVRHQRPATAATDLFLAARCVTYLAGGDPVRDRVPESVPAPLGSFLRGCVLEGVKMRPADAWALHDEFETLLRQVYGPPQFHLLDMH